MNDLLSLLETLGTVPAEVWLVPPVLIVLGIAGGIWLRRKADLNRCRRIADRLALRVNPRTIVDVPEIVGEYHGRRLVMTTVSNQRARRTIRRSWTRITVAVRNPTFISLHLRPQDLLDTMLTSVGLEDIETGDEIFDRRFVIRSDDVDLAKELWSDKAVRDRFVDTRIDSVQLSGENLAVYYPRVEKDVEHAERLCNAATSLASRIDALQRVSRPEILR
jgi:hypothetical protein